MDYIDLISGQTVENFYFKSKKELIDILLSKIKLFNSKFLDIGAGIGSDLAILNRFGDIYTIDTNQKALDMIPNKLCKEKNM